MLNIPLIGMPFLCQEKNRHNFRVVDKKNENMVDARKEVVEITRGN
jgi:hypothetical protein